MNKQDLIFLGLMIVISVALTIIIAELSGISDSFISSI